MAKAAASEPSMDDILSSIRQIISDDDENEISNEAKAPADEVHVEVEITNEVEESTFDIPEETPEEITDFEAEQPIVEQNETLELTSEQIVDEEGESDVAVGDMEMPEMVVPDDISFEESEPLDEPVEEITSQKSLPDPDLSSDIADKLLEPATDAAVSNAFSKLGALGFSDKDLTIENMIREMLRPMLKTWLDENLPSVVETMVRKEIERLSRGA